MKVIRFNLKQLSQNPMFQSISGNGFPLCAGKGTGAGYATGNALCLITNKSLGICNAVGTARGAGNAFGKGRSNEYGEPKRIDFYEVTEI